MFKKKTLDNVVWEITLECNARCLHCGSAAGKARADELTTEEALDLCDQFGDIACRRINLIGGELFLRPDWKQITQRLSDNNVEVSIITNGIALTKEKVDFLAGLKFNTIGISLDGGTAETNDYIRQVPGLFNKIFKIMEYIATKDMGAVAITTLNKLNVYELGILRERLINSPFKAWQIQIAASHGRMKSDLSLDLFAYYISGLFFGQSRIKVPIDDLAIICNHDFGYYSKVIPRHVGYSNWMGCVAGKGVLGIRSDGKVQGCLSIYQDEFTEGDIRKQSLKEIYYSRKLCKWNKRFNRFLSLTGFCRYCEFSMACLGGCSDIAYSLTGNVGENPQCYHAIETHWKKANPRNDFEKLFKEITQGYMDKDGTFYLESGEALSWDYIKGLNITQQNKSLLELIAVN